MANCPCSTGLTYEQCCKPIIDSDAAINAEQLMRSRYTAYCTQNYQYIVLTYATAAASKVDEEGLRRSCQDSQWLALTIHSSNTNTVSFSAYFCENKSVYLLQEKSRFVQEFGKWRYLGGNTTQNLVTVARNEYCFCGSKKKFKRCCLNKIS